MDQGSQRERPDVSAEERQSTELVKRVCKLRWIGLEEESGRIIRLQISRAMVGTLCANPPNTN